MAEQTMKNGSARICLITGGTSGIGAATALQLARYGITVVIVGRNIRRCIRQVQSIRRKVPNARVEYLVADLSSQQEVRHLASEFTARYHSLDILINNAGAYFGKREISVDGLEMSFALNHMAYFLLTNLLVDSLKKSTDGRVVVVSSGAHVNGTIDFNDLQTVKNYSAMKAYSQSKLANLLFTYALGRRLKGTRVTVNALDPGFVATNLGSNNNWLRTRLRNLLKRTMLRPAEGARTVVYLATSPEVDGVSGQYFYECRPIRSSDGSYDETIAEKLWTLSEELSRGMPAERTLNDGNNMIIHTTRSKHSLLNESIQ